MPCRSDEDDCYGPSARARLEKEFEHDSTVAEMLCAVLRSLENTGKMPGLLGTFENRPRKTLETWWAAHKARDEKRLAEEAAEARRKTLRATALSKLTDEELRELGLPKK